MGWGMNQTSFMPSEKSVQTGNAKGVEAGGKFLERAAEDMRDIISEKMAKIVYKYIEGMDIS
jgi:hypothetical protein